MYSMQQSHPAINNTQFKTKGKCSAEKTNSPFLNDWTELITKVFQQEYHMCSLFRVLFVSIDSTLPCRV